MDFALLNQIPIILVFPFNDRSVSSWQDYRYRSSSIMTASLPFTSYRPGFTYGSTWSQPEPYSPAMVQIAPSVCISGTSSPYVWYGSSLPHLLDPKALSTSPGTRLSSWLCQVTGLYFTFKYRDSPEDEKWKIFLFPLPIETVTIVTGVRHLCSRQLVTNNQANRTVPLKTNKVLSIIQKN